jgi:hypothetical protein
MLGIWGQSCLRPPLAGTLKVVGARNFHTSGAGTRSVLNLRNRIPTHTHSFRHAFRTFPTQRFNSTQAPPPPTTSPTAPKTRSLLSRFIPSPSDVKTGTLDSKSSFKKIVALAKPEWKPLSIAIGLLLASSAVSMSIPFTIGRLIDFFSTANPVS